MYNIHHRKNYVLGQNAETAMMMQPEIDPGNLPAPSPGLPVIGNLLSGPMLWAALGAAGAAFLGPKLHRTRSAIVGAAAGFGVHFFMNRPAAIIVEEGEVEEQF